MRFVAHQIIRSFAAIRRAASTIGSGGKRLVPDYVAWATRRIRDHSDGIES